MSTTTLDSSRDEARELVDFLHKQAAYFRRHGGAALRHEADALANAAALLDSYQAGITLATPHALSGAELIVWTAVEKALPDADITSLLRINGEDEVYVWAGYYDGEQWISAEGLPLGQSVTHWADFPAGPRPLPCTAASASEVPA